MYSVKIKMLLNTSFVEDVISFSCDVREDAMCGAFGTHESAKF
jgi:hypothetical protein